MPSTGQSLNKNMLSNEQMNAVVEDNSFMELNFLDEEQKGS